MSWATIANRLFSCNGLLLCWSLRTYAELIQNWPYCISFSNRSQQLVDERATSVEFSARGLFTCMQALGFAALKGVVNSSWYARLQLRSENSTLVALSSNGCWLSGGRCYSWYSMVNFVLYSMATVYFLGLQHSESIRKNSLLPCAALLCKS